MIGLSNKSFNLDPCKQAQEIIFSRKLKKPPHTTLVFINDNVPQTFSLSLSIHLGFYVRFQTSI